jgi:hypothetical protein
MRGRWWSRSISIAEFQAEGPSPAQSGWSPDARILQIPVRDLAQVMQMSFNVNGEEIEQCLTCGLTRQQEHVTRADR